MEALPGLTLISLTKEWTKALVSVISLVLRNSLISSAKVAMVSVLSKNCRCSASSPQLLLRDHPRSVAKCEGVPELVNMKLLNL